MTTLTVSGNTNYTVAPASSLVNGQNITVIQFALSNASFYTAFFNASQFGGSSISNSVLIQGNSGGDHIQVLNITNYFSAAGWSFSNWTSTNDLIQLFGSNLFNDMIFGSSVNDHIQGGGGVDSLYGGDGNDGFYVSAGEVVSGDLMDGGNGTDRLFMMGGTVDFRVASVTGIESLGFMTSTSAEAQFYGHQLGAGLVSSIAGINPTVDKLTVFGRFESNGFETIGLGINLADVTFSNWGTEDVITLNGTVFREDLYGSSQADVINGLDDDDGLHGGLGNDTLNGDDGDDGLNGHGGNDTLNGGAGEDTMAGGLGDDTYIIDSVSDGIQENPGEGTDTLNVGFSYSGRPANVEIVQLTGTGAINLTGSTGDDILRGNSATNTILGGVGADVIAGQGGKDLMTGGAGLDRIVLESLSDSGVTFAARDVINTFAHGDKIDVSAIDAKTSVAGDQAFVFVSAFTGVAGQLQWDLTNVSPTGVKGYLVQGDVNGDSNADFSLQIYTAPTQSLPGGPDAWNLASWDFIL